MGAVSWNPDLITGIDDIDQDHREIFVIANRLAADPAGHESMGGALAILKTMEVHVARHFAAEEELMLRHDYPMMLEHMVEHGRILDYVTSLCREVRDDGADVDVLSVANRLLCTWMVSHIITLDR